MAEETEKDREENASEDPPWRQSSTESESETEAESSSPSEGESSSSSDADSSSDSSSSEGEGEIDASNITAPSIGPNTTIEHIPPEERLDMDKISDIDAMGLDKRRQVGGRRYGASPAKQAAVYGGALAVIAGLVIGGIILTNELDTAPPEGEGPVAPWADNKLDAPEPIDFPQTTDP